MMQTQPFEKHVWAEIDLEALRHNFRAVKARAGALPLCAVVKADSYGHGAVQCARVFAEEGAAWLAVSCLTEAVQLRKGGLTLPILVLGHVQPGYAAALIQNHITVACYSAAQAKALSDAAVAAGGRVQIHLKADTGMGRIGFALRTDFDAACREMLAACDAAVIPMFDASCVGVPYKIADYAAAGLPILNTLHGETARLLRDYGAGVLSPAGDEAALYERTRSPLLRGVRAADVSLRAAHRRGRAAALYALLGAARRGELLHALRTAFPSAMGLLGGGAVLLCAISGGAAAVAPKSLW